MKTSNAIARIWPKYRMRRKHSGRFKLQQIRSKTETQPETELAFIEVLASQILRGCDHRIAAEVAYASIGIQREIRRVCARIGEMRRVGEIEGLHAELQPPVFLYRKLT